MSTCSRAPRRISLPAETLELLRAAARRCAPREACGVWLGRTRGGSLAVHAARELSNQARGSSAFEFDPGELRWAYGLAEELGLELLGVWHSHPAGPPRPSARDLLGTPPGWCQVILAGSRGERLGAWWRGRRGFLPLELEPGESPPGASRRPRSAVEEEIQDRQLGGPDFVSCAASHPIPRPRP